MKKLFTINLCLSILLFSCRNNNSNENLFTISGELKNTESVILYKLGLSQMTPVDTSLVENGLFNIKATYNKANFYRLNFSNGNSIRLFIDTNSTITLNADAENIINYTLSGSKESANLMELDKMVLKSFAKLDSVNDNLRKDTSINSIELRTRFTTEYNTTSTNLKNKLQNFIRKKSNSPISIMALFQPFGNNALFNPKTDLDLFRLVEENLNSQYKKTEFSKYLSTEIQRSLAGKIGSKAPNFTLNDTNGKPVSLNDYKGKLLLIDFWASWCAPCRKENPYLVKLYKEFNPKGLEILGVSLDGTPRQKNPEEDWLNAIKNDGLLWRQVSDLRGWESITIAMYGFNGIPHTVLIDENGIIIATKLRGKALEDKLIELLN